MSSSIWKDKILEGIATKKAKVVFDAPFSMEGFLKEIAAYEPKLLGYINGLSSKGSALKNEITVKLSNHDVDFGDIYFVTNASQVISVLCAYSGALKNKVIFVYNKKFDIESAKDRFLDEKSSFYPAVTALASTDGSFGSFEYATMDITIKYRMGKVKLKMLEIEVSAEVDRLSKLLFTKDMPDYVKAYLAHNYLASTVTYSKKEGKNDLDVSYLHSAYGALILKDCVCQGYSEAFKRLMMKAGIECEVVSGQVYGSDEHHAWNMAKLGGRFYHIDSTWDSEKGKVDYKYFCVTDAFMKKERRWDKHEGISCIHSDDILEKAQSYVSEHKKELRGIPQSVLDC